MKKRIIIFLSLFLIVSCGAIQHNIILEKELTSNVFIGKSQSGDNYGIWLKNEEVYDSLSRVGPSYAFMFREPDSVKVFDKYIMGYRGQKYFIMYNDSSGYKVESKETKRKEIIDEIIKELEDEY